MANYSIQTISDNYKMTGYGVGGFYGEMWLRVVKAEG